MSSLRQAAEYLCTPHDLTTEPARAAVLRAPGASDSDLVDAAWFAAESWWAYEFQRIADAREAETWLRDPGDAPAEGERLLALHSPTVERRARGARGGPPMTKGEFSWSLMAKLGSLAVHADEATGPEGHPFDVLAIRSILDDPEVVALLADLGKQGLLPAKRRP